MDSSLCIYGECVEPAVLMLTAVWPGRRRHEDLCLAHVGQRASDLLHEPFGPVDIRVERIWEQVEAERV